MPYASASYTIEDYDGEQSTMSVNLGIINGAALDATVVAIQNGQSFIEGITRGRVRKWSLTLSGQLDAQTVDDAEAQRETKWLVQYRDNTAYLDAPANTITNPGYGKLFYVEVPTALFTGLRTNNQDIADVTATPIVDFTAWFEANAKSPYSGDALIQKIEAVGRNL